MAMGKFRELLVHNRRAAAIVAVMALSLTGASTKPYSPQSKAFYADQATVEYVWSM